MGRGLRQSLTIVLAFAALGACGFDISRPDPNLADTQPQPSTGLPTGQVTWIDDGDSIEVDLADTALDIRLIGINAPESGECQADASLDYLIDTIKLNEVAIDEYDTDQFGRTLADVWFDDELVNLKLVTMGMATAITPDGSYPHGEAMLAAEDSAFAARVGMWGLDICGASGVPPAIEFDLADSQTNPSGPDDEVLDNEYITIVNRGEVTVDMGNWVLRDESSRNRLMFPPGTDLLAGERMTISSGCSTTVSWCGTTPIWNNAGDLALLLDSDGRVVARARY